MRTFLEYITMLYYYYVFYWCSVDELQRLLKDKEAYNAFFNSLDQVKTQNNVSLLLHVPWSIVLLTPSWYS